MTPLRDITAWLRGDPFQCLQPPAVGERVWRLVLLGPPGVGKGTQARMLSTALPACALSTGDLFRSARDHSHAPNSAMAEAIHRVDRGELVPDDVVLSLIHERRGCLRCRGGFLLDGFPRTIRQAVALDGILTAERLSLDAVIEYEMPFTNVVERLSGRRICGRCQAPYHLTLHPPAHAGLCDHCGSVLVQRADDRPAAIGARLRAYLEATAQVADFYRKRGLLVTVDASAAPKKVFAHTLDALAARGLPAAYASA